MPEFIERIKIMPVTGGEKVFFLGRVAFTDNERVNERIRELYWVGGEAYQGMTWDFYYSGRWNVRIGEESFELQNGFNSLLTLKGKVYIVWDGTIRSDPTFMETAYIKYVAMNGYYSPSCASYDALYSLISHT